MYNKYLLFGTYIKVEAAESNEATNKTQEALQSVFLDKCFLASNY